RHFSIITKLAREPTMGLTRMHDIGGCRAVVATIQEGYAIRDRWLATGRTGRVDDYIAKPKTRGYRGIHGVTDYYDRLIEVQLRTEVQHEWAFTVERVGGRIREDLKGGRGTPEVLAFFELASKAMELEEAGDDVPEDLVAAVRAARERADPF